MNTRSIPPSSPVSVRDASDDALVSLLRAGSSAAAGELYRRHAPYLKSALRSRVSPAAAADVVQDVFVVLLANPRFTPAPGRVKSWLRGIAMRLAAKRRGQLVEESLTDGEAMLCDDAWPEYGDEMEAGVNEKRGR